MLAITGLSECFYHGQRVSSLVNPVQSAATPEFWRKLAPALATLEVLPRLVAVLQNEFLVALVPNPK